MSLFGRCLEKHRKLMHETSEKYACHLCKRVYRQKQDLDRHVLNHNNYVHCQYCDFKTLVKSNLDGMIYLFVS